MSYEIIYDKQFIKIPQKESKDRFIPMILSGSNNCYEWSSNNRERRARNWSCWNWLLPKNKLSSTEAEMASILIKWRDDIKERTNKRNKEYIANNEENWVTEYDDKSFGYFSSLAINGSTRNTTFGRVLGIVKTGAKKALTIEQLIDEHIYVTIKTGYYADKQLKETGLDKFSIIINSTEHLLEVIKKAENYIEQGISINVEVRISESSMKWIRRKYFPRNRKDYEFIEVDKYYTVSMPSGYLVKKTRKGYKYTYYPYLKYRTIGEANRRAKSCGGVVEEINEKARVKVYT